VADGRIKALWVIATNPLHSWIGRGGAKTEIPNPKSEGGPDFDSILSRIEFLVVQDMFTTTETARRAHLVLPAAGWGEKEGTFINSERRIGLTKKVSRAPGEALSDFNIFRLVAAYWGCGDLFREWSSPEAAFQILKRLSAGQPCDITGIRDYRDLDEAGGIQWPLPETGNAECGMRNDAGNAADSEFRIPSSELKERRLFADGKFFTPDGRAKFLFDPPRPVAEPVDDEYPFVLLTGRGTSAQWHTNTRTGKSAVLRTLYPANPYAEIHPDDAARLGIAPNSTVTVGSRRGRIQCVAFVTGTVAPGQVFIPMHYDVTNRLTRADYDPHSRQPSYKHCAVRIEPCAEGRETKP
jgi:assimilatory nitrate reductase catalytic subunit